MVISAMKSSLRPLVGISMHSRRTKHIKEGNRSPTISTKFGRLVPGIWAPGRIEYEWFDVDKDDSIAAHTSAHHAG